MFWLYLLAAVTVLSIAYRRVLLRQKPLDDELFSRAVAFEHVHSGIAWVKSDGLVSSMNSSLAATLLLDIPKARGMSWFDLFDPRDRARLEAAYSQMLLAGKGTIEVHGRNRLVPRKGDLEAANEEPLLQPAGQSLDQAASLEHPELDLLLVAVHDHKMRFVGHYCLVADRTRERMLEAHLREARQERDRLKTDLLMLNTLNRGLREENASAASASGATPKQTMLQA